MPRDLVDALPELGVLLLQEIGLDVAIISRSRRAGSVRIVWRQSPPPPGVHRGRCGWFHSPSFRDQFSPPSRDSKSAEGSTPQKSRSGSSSSPDSICQTFASEAPEASGKEIRGTSGRLQRRPKSSLAQSSAPQWKLLGAAQIR